ncbi:MAG TPA: hypothetical protein PLC42_02665 [Parachlamydiaceae bacterium]|nr:hypothetical protein [Parachlamydiaceae bacterium]
MPKANDSPQVEKYRKKLKKTLENEKKLINEEAIKKTKASIHKWLVAQSKQRISLKNKEINLFDEKQHPAITKSKFILKLSENLKAAHIKNKPITTEKFKASKLS